MRPVHIFVVVAVTTFGCGELRGRKIIKEANDRYRQGRYQDAVTLFEAAETWVPDLPVLWLNKGYTCRQLIMPAPKGADLSPDSRRAADPRYPEAMTYLGLLYRQKSFAYFDQPAKWRAAVDAAQLWQQRAAEARTGAVN